MCRNQQQPGFTRWGACSRPHHNSVRRCECRGGPRRDRRPRCCVGRVPGIDGLSRGCRTRPPHRRRGAVRAWLRRCRSGCGGTRPRPWGACRGGRCRERRARLGESYGCRRSRRRPGVSDVGALVHELSGGAHVSVDCLGHVSTVSSSILGLRPLGRHVQIGLFPSPTATIPISRVIRDEFEVLTWSPDTALSSKRPVKCRLSSGPAGRCTGRATFRLCSAAELNRPPSRQRAATSAIFGQRVGITHSVSVAM